MATPRWLGFVIQRPEMHNIHHARRVHRYNYADLPLIDMLFGTYRNPRSVEDLPCGLYDGASSRIGAMLIGRDVSRAPQSGNSQPEVSPSEPMREAA
jgi:hypothetical protein